MSTPESAETGSPPAFRPEIGAIATDTRYIPSPPTGLGSGTLLETEFSKVATQFVVTLRHAPSLWLTHQDDLLDMPISCVVSKTDSTLKVDLARPLHPLPADMILFCNSYRRQHLRRAFRVALRAAIEGHLGEPVSPIPEDRIEWEVRV